MASGKWHATGGFQPTNNRQQLEAGVALGQLPSGQPYVTTLTAGAASASASASAAFVVVVTT